jgi:hypothetical protein
MIHFEDKLPSRFFCVRLSELITAPRACSLGRARVKTPKAASEFNTNPRASEINASCHARRVRALWGARD